MRGFADQGRGNGFLGKTYFIYAAVGTPVAAFSGLTVRYITDLHVCEESWETDTFVSGSFSPMGLSCVAEWGDRLWYRRRMNSIAGRDLAVSAGAVSSNPGAGSSRVLHVELTSQQVTLHL